MIKVITGETPKKEKEFPKLMISTTGNIVLFESSGKGTVIRGVNNKENGMRIEGWNMNNFTDYNEPVTIVNA